MKKGWQTKHLGDVAAVGAGNSAPQDEALFEDGTIPFFRTADAGRVRFGDIAESTDYLNDKGVKGLRRFAAGTILFPKSGASTFLNHRVILGVEGCVSSHLATIVADEKQAHPRFLLYFLSTIEAQDLVQDHAYPSLNLPTIAGIEVHLPPLAEQQRIVGLLDEAFEGLATAKANAEKNLENARALFESHLQSVFGQRSKGWVEKKLSALYNIGSSKRVLKSEWKTEGVPFYRGREVTRLAADGFVDNELFISEDHFADLSKEYGVPEAGDIVITAIGTIGNAHVVRSTDRFYFKDASVLWMKRTTDVSSEFIRFWLKSSLFFDQLDRGNGATVDTLTIQKLQSVGLRLPQLEEQKKIVTELDGLTEETQRLARHYERKHAALDSLKKSLLHQAFTGAL